MIVPRRIEAVTAPSTRPHHVWYAAFRSNMRRDRLNQYLAGGRPPGGARAYPGCRDSLPPARSAPVMLPGVLYE